MSVLFNKNTLMGLLACLMVFKAQAHDLSADTDSFVYIPELQAGFTVDASAIWLKPSADNLNYTILTNDVPAQSPSWYEQEIKPNFDPGFEIGLNYNFQNARGKGVDVNWVHLRSSTNAAQSIPDEQYFLGPDYEIGPDAVGISNVVGNATFQYDVVNLQALQWINIGSDLSIGFLGGLGSVFLNESVTATFSGVLTSGFTGPFSTSTNVVSNFDGVGPRFGLLSKYNINHNWGISGAAGVTALIGTLTTNTGLTSTGAQLTDLFNQNINYQTIHDQHILQVVPALDTKLSIHYSHRLHDHVVTVTGGYAAAVYVNAIHQYLPASIVQNQSITSGGVFVATMSHAISNFSVNGPFVNLALQY